jgi:hypothetical protein
MLHSFWAGVFMGPFLYSFVHTEVELIKGFLWTHLKCQRKIIVPKYKFSLAQEVSDSDDEHECTQECNTDSSEKVSTPFLNALNHDGPITDVSSDGSSDVHGSCELLESNLPTCELKGELKDELKDELTGDSRTPSDSKVVAPPPSPKIVLPPSSIPFDPEFKREGDLLLGSSVYELKTVGTDQIETEGLKPVEIADAGDECGDDCHKNQVYLCICRKRNWPSGYPASA